MIQLSSKLALNALLGKIFIFSLFMAGLEKYFPLFHSAPYDGAPTWWLTAIAIIQLTLGVFLLFYLLLYLAIMVTALANKPMYKWQENRIRAIYEG